MGAQAKHIADEVSREVRLKKDAYLAEEERLKTKVSSAENAIAQSKTLKEKHSAEKKETVAKELLKNHQKTAAALDAAREKEKSHKAELAAALSSRKRLLESAKVNAKIAEEKGAKREIAEEKVQKSNKNLALGIAEAEKEEKAFNKAKEAKEKAQFQATAGDVYYEVLALEA